MLERRFKQFMKRKKSAKQPQTYRIISLGFQAGKHGLNRIVCDHAANERA